MSTNNIQNTEVHIIYACGKMIHDHKKFFYLGCIVESFPEFNSDVINKYYEYCKKSEHYVVKTNAELCQFDKLTTDINEVKQLNYALR
jgi:hypothetical protein